MIRLLEPFTDEADAECLLRREGPASKSRCATPGAASKPSTTTTARLIEEYKVQAIIGYNIGPQNSEYEIVADAGILYIHSNTLLQHHDTVSSDPDRYFGCFMADPAEYWYGQGFIKFISWLRDTGQWRPKSNRLAIMSGSKPYSIVIANAMADAASQFGWTVAFGRRSLRRRRMRGLPSSRRLSFVRQKGASVNFVN